MKRAFRAFGLTLASLMAIFQPMQATHGTTMCCAECQMIKKDDEIEVVDETPEDITA